MNTSGLHSNAKSRSTQYQKLVTNPNIWNYTQEAIPKHTLTDKSRSISKESANVSISTICKGIEARTSLNQNSIMLNSKQKHKLKIDKHPHNVRELNEESFEIYSKFSKNKLKLPKSKKYTNKLNSKMCPITIIQAPITVNGDSSVNVHQSIVLANSKHKAIGANKHPGSHKHSLDHKQLDLNVKNLKAINDYDILVKKSNKTSATNPYSKKFCVKQPVRASTQHSNYSNMEMSCLAQPISAQYSVASSFNKKQSADLCRSTPNQSINLRDKSRKVSKIRMKKYKKASESAHKRL